MTTNFYPDWGPFFLMLNTMAIPYLFDYMCFHWMSSSTNYMTDSTVESLYFLLGLTVFHHALHHLFHLDLSFQVIGGWGDLFRAMRLHFQPFTTQVACVFLLLAQRSPLPFNSDHIEPSPATREQHDTDLKDKEIDRLERQSRCRKSIIDALRSQAKKNDSKICLLYTSDAADE